MEPVRRDVARDAALRIKRQLNHRWLPMWRTNVVLQILHFACGSVQDDIITVFVYGDKECLSELPLPVFLSAAKNLEKKGGTTDREQGYFALRCVSVDYKKLMFAVRIASLRTGQQSLSYRSPDGRSSLCQSQEPAGYAGVECEYLSGMRMPE